VFELLAVMEENRLEARKIVGFEAGLGGDG